MERSNRARLLYADEGRMMVYVAAIGDLEELERAATPEERASIEGFSSTSRRAERLAWRALLREVVSGPICNEINIEYNPQGAPSLREPIRIGDFHYTHISVSHCRQMVAITVSTSPCGIDIESLERGLERLAERYMTPKERGLSDDKRLASAVWSAKEALYKVALRSGLDLRRDIEITSADLRKGRLVGKVAECGQIELRVHWIEPQHILVHTL